MASLSPTWVAFWIRQLINLLQADFGYMQPNVIPIELEYLSLPTVFRVWNWYGLTPQSSSWAIVANCL